MRASAQAHVPTRDEAWALVCKYVQNPALRRHMLVVETVMRAYARKLGDDEELFGVVGLLHDFDWEIHPHADEHPELGAQMLEQLGYPANIVKAIRGHATYLGVPRDTPVAKALYACDELTGFLTAVAYVRPSKSIRDVTVDSVRKKLKDKRFAANVNRQEVYEAAEEFGVPLEEHIAFLVSALSENATELGL